MLAEAAPFVESQQEEKTVQVRGRQSAGCGGEGGWGCDRVEFGQLMPSSGNSETNQMRSSQPQTPPTYRRGRTINRPV